MCAALEGIDTFSVNMGIPGGLQFDEFFQLMLTVPIQLFALPDELTMTVVGVELTGEQTPF
jgi:hypothetical protein